MIGKKAKCKKCNTSFRLPGPPSGDSVGESQGLSVVAMPGLTDDDEAVPMATAVEESELLAEPLHSPPAAEIASLPSADPFDFAAPSALTSKPAKPAPPASPAKPAFGGGKASPPEKPASSPGRPAIGGTPPGSSPGRPGFGKTPSKSTPGRPALPPPPPPPPPPEQELLSLDDDDPPLESPLAEAVPVVPAPDPFAFGAVPPESEEPKSQKKAKKQSEEVEESAKPKTKKTRKEKEDELSDPFQTPFSPAPETVSDNDPFAFTAGDAAPAAKPKSKKPERDEDQDEEKPKKKRKSPNAEPQALPEAPPAAADPFAFNEPSPAPTSKSQKQRSDNDDQEEKPKKKKKAAEEPAAAAIAAADDPFSFNSAPAAPAGRGRDDDEEETTSKKRKGNDQDGEEDNSDRKYHRPGEKKSNGLLWVAAIAGVIAVGAIVAAVIVFTKDNDNQAKKTTEKKEEPPAPAPSDPPPPEDPKGPKKDKKDPGKKDVGKKDPGDTTTPRDPKNPPEQPPQVMAVLPKGLPTYTFRAPNENPERTQRPSKQPVQIDVPFEKVKRFFPSIDGNLCDSIVVWQSNPGFNGRGEKLLADIYSGSVGKKIAQLDFDGDGKDVKCDFSIDGKVFAAASDGKVTVWNLADKKKLLDGFDPYADKPAHKKAGLAAVYIPSMSNPYYILTVSTAGAMHLFEIEGKTLRGEFIPENSGPGRVFAGKNVAMDEMRSVIVIAVGGLIHQLKSLDLSPIPTKLSFRGDAGRSFGIAVAGMPGRVAYAFETDNDGKKERAILFSLPSNPLPRIYRWQDSAGEPVSVNWSSMENVVVGTTTGVVWFEYDADFSPVAFAKIPNGKGLHETTERSHWYLIPSPKEPTKSIMADISFPLEGLIDFRNHAAAKKPLETLRLDEQGLWR